MNLHEFFITGYAVDTRNLKPGNLFFALKGAKTDGHAHLEEAKNRGATCAVVGKEYSGSDFGLNLIKVDNVLETLQTQAKNVIDSLSMPIVAITGSVGKTTTKDFVMALLSESFRVAYFSGNQNSQIGLPLGILNYDFKNKDILVLEMGMDMPGQISRLIQIAPPDIAILTATALVHAKNFDSLEAIGREKAEIFTHPKTRIGIMSRDIVNYDELALVGSCKKISFSASHPNADFYLKKEASGFSINGNRFDPLPVPGDHNLHNFLGAVVVARQLGLHWDEIRAGALKLKLPEKRLQIMSIRGATFVNDAYNACEVSMKAAIESLPAPKAGCKKIACLGEMGELGAFSKQCHDEVGKKSLEHIDLMLCLGKECQPIVERWKAAEKPVFYFDERIKLVEKLREVLCEGDSVLVKASNFKEMWKVFEEL